MKAIGIGINFLISDVIFGRLLVKRLGLSTKTVVYRSLWISFVATTILAFAEIFSARLNNQIQHLEWAIGYFVICFGGVFGFCFNILRGEFADKFKALDAKFELLSGKDIEQFKVLVINNDADITESVDRYFYNFVKHALLFNLDRHKSYKSTVDLVFFCFTGMSQHKKELCS